jgi:glycogen debranching enzyme
LPISHAGAFCYWVEYDSNKDGSRVKGREGYFNIDPILRTKGRAPIVDGSEIKGDGLKVLSDDVRLPLDGLSILTVVSKWMGTLSEWEKHFQEAAERGYTMLHYTPLQERGSSDSPYSIRNQAVYDPSMFDSKDDLVDGGKTKIERVLGLAKEKYGLLSLTDVVLNHTASDSPWLIEHPEAGALSHPSSAMTLLMCS